MSFELVEMCDDCPVSSWLAEPTEATLCECGHHAGLPSMWHGGGCLAYTPKPECHPTCPTKGAS